MTFTTTWMDLEGLKLSEISQKKENKYCMISRVKSKEVKLIETNNKIVAASDWRVGETGRCLSKGTNFQL